VIVDCFLFLNEWDILDLRLATLIGAVDKFVLLRGDRTFRGDTIVESQVSARLEPLMKKYPLDACVVELPKSVASPWEREYIQRSSSGRAIEALMGIADSDLILLSDVDEIPGPYAIDGARRIADAGHVVCFEQLHSYYALNLVDDEPWYGTRAVLWNVLKTTTAQALRASWQEQAIVRAGWHFGWIGGNDAIRTKVASFCHEELDKPALVSDQHLDICRARRITMHNGHSLRPISLMAMPACVRDDPRRYAHMLVNAAAC
jgi:beta-1,4-mannosyl-glycoprotein beta-1,4-N-acetylglucosaminyltransferase